MTEKQICAYCEDEIEDPDDYGMTGDEGTEYAGQNLHESCYSEPEPCATLVFSDGGPQDQGEYPYYITPTRNDTEGVFAVKWVSTDPWRGYYDLASDTWEQVHTDCILSYSEDAENLKRFDELLQDLLNREEIRYIRGFPRTSNLFSCGYELWIPKEDKDRYDALIAQAKEAHQKELRDPSSFRLTALTGKDPGECDEKDRLFALLGGLILSK